MKLRRFLPLGGLLLLSGCAKSPSSTGPIVTVPNRLAVTLTTKQNLSAEYYYAVAFDDNPSDGAGPQGIVGNTSRVTPPLNRIVGGNFRLAVIYQNNRFRLFRRSDPANPSTETEITTAAFIGTPSASGNTVSFTLNLDARLPNGNFVFAHDVAGQLPSTLDVNFVTTNTIIDNTDERIKPVDANEAFQTSRFFGFDIGASRNYSQDDPEGDRQPDVHFSFLPGGSQAANFGQLDVIQFSLALTRG